MKAYSAAQHGLETVGHKLHTQWEKLPSIPNIHEHRRSRKAAVIITRIGFLSKAALYFAIGALSINSAVLQKRNAAYGPAQLQESLRKTYVLLVLLTVGVFCYAVFAFMFSIFDFDQLGHKGCMPALARFGRIFSAGFYAYIGVNGIAVLTSDAKSGGTSNRIVQLLFESPAGKGALVFLGIIFCVVALVYITYIIKPAKFRRELASERMHPKVFAVCVYVARVGALGRVFFFASFGGGLIHAVQSTHGGTTGDTDVLGLAAVLNNLAELSVTFMCITAGLIMVYAVWCLILTVFRRLPAHSTERSALAAVGIKYYLKHPDKNNTGVIPVGDEGLNTIEMIPVESLSVDRPARRPSNHPEAQPLTPKVTSSSAARRGSKFNVDEVPLDDIDVESGPVAGGGAGVM